MLTVYLTSRGPSGISRSTEPSSFIVIFMVSFQAVLELLIIIVISSSNEQLSHTLKLLNTVSLTNPRVLLAMNWIV